MNTKLTLSIDNQIIHFAKKIAIQKHISVSKLVENYIRSLIQVSQPNVSKFSKIAKLKGSFKVTSQASDKENISSALRKNHL